MGGADVLRRHNGVFFFAFDLRLESYARRSGHTIGPDSSSRDPLRLYE